MIYPKINQTIVLAYLPVLFFIFLNANAQSSSSGTRYSPEELQAQVLRLQGLIDEVVLDLKSQLKPEELTTLESLEAQATPHEEIRLVYATIQNGHQVIKVSLGFMNVITQVLDASLLAFHSSKMDDLDAYQQKLLDDLMNSSQNTMGSELQEPPLTFDRFVNMSQDQAEQYREKSRRGMIVGFYSTLAIVLAHELGHHVLGHLESVEKLTNKTDGERSQIELDADAFAFTLVAHLMGKPEYRLLSALQIYPFLAHVQDATSGITENSMDMPVRRIIQASEAVFKQCDADPIFQKILKDTGLKVEWDEGVSKFQSYASKVPK